MELFVRFIKGSKWDKYLKDLDWKELALSLCFCREYSYFGLQSLQAVILIQQSETP